MEPTPFNLPPSGPPEALPPTDLSWPAPPVAPAWDSPSAADALPPPAGDPFGAPQQPRRQLRLKSTTYLAVSIQVLTALIVLHAFISVVLEDDLARLLNAGADDGFWTSEMVRHYDRSASMALVGMILFALNGILMIVMMKRMADNGAAMRPGFSDHKSHWAITGWFVPFLNFVRPYQMVLQIWITSHRNTEDRYTPRLPMIINLWWASFVILLIADRAAPSAPWANATVLQVANESRGMSIVSAIRGFAGFLFIYTVRTIAAQHERALAEHR